uniref:Ion transport domain-containing protein n=1 Tax=Plectus sambesii TaxID=2011161 RepID=A0A914XR22_9BILA
MKEEKKGILIKVCALSFIGPDAYLDDTWNRLDFFIVIAGCAEYLLQEYMGNINLTAIRTIRVLRPLRAVNRIPSMRILVNLLLDTLPMLGNVLLLCFFVFFIFGIVGVQLWAGLLRNRCIINLPRTNFSFNVTDVSLTRYYIPDDTSMEYICSRPDAAGIHSCDSLPPSTYKGQKCNKSIYDWEVYTPSNVSCINWNQYYNECAVMHRNPFQGSISFDNIGFAWVAIFLVISLEGWTDIMYYVQDAHSFWNWIYFVLLIVIGAFFMINLCLVVIATQFAETKRRETERMLAERARIQSSSSISGSDRGAQEGGGDSVYAAFVRFVAHMSRKAKRKFAVWWQQFLRWRRRRKQGSSNATSNDNDDLTATPSKSEARNPPVHGRRTRSRHGSQKNKRRRKKRRSKTSHEDDTIMDESGKVMLRTDVPRITRVQSEHTSPKIRSRFSSTGDYSAKGGSLRQRPGAHGMLNVSNGEDALSPDSGRRSARSSQSQYLSAQEEEAGSSVPSLITGQTLMDDVKDINIIGTDPSTSERTAIIKGRRHHSDASNDDNDVTGSKTDSSSRSATDDEDSTSDLTDASESELDSHTYSKDTETEAVTAAENTAELLAIRDAESLNSRKRLGHIGRFRRMVKDFVDGDHFTRGILVAILVNTLSMGVEYHQQPEGLTLVLEYSNYFFTGLFALEMCLKIVAEGPFGYLADGFNLFDGGIVALSVLELFQEGKGGLSVLRTFRLLRILKLVRFMPALRYQLVVMLRTMDNVTVFFGLLVLFIFIFSILGMNLFGCKFCKDEEGDFGTKIRKCERKNFDSLLWALITVFQ